MGKVNLFLCKPNKQKISKLVDIYGTNLVTKEGVVNELMFSIPSFVEINRELVKNPLIDKIKGYYLVYLEFDDIKEYFVFLNENKNLSTDGEYIDYTLYSLGYLLNNKTIREYNEISLTLHDHVSNFLSDTDWTIDYIDADFELMYRSFDISTGTALQAIYDVAKKFGALIKWDTIQQKISFYKTEKVGLNRGLKFKEGKFIESYNATFNYDDMVTRLYCYGENGLEFRSLTPTGANFIQDFSWFMVPFEYDSDYNVLKSSDYMSDELCLALVKYNKKLSDSDNLITRLSEDRTKKTSEITKVSQELSELEIIYKNNLNSRDVFNAMYQDEAPLQPEYNGIIDALNKSKLAVDEKYRQLGTLELELLDIEKELFELRDELAIENNLSKENLLELNKFIIHKEFNDSTITNEKDLLEAGLKAFEKLKSPSISLTLSIADFLSDTEFINERHKLALGDTVKTYSKNLNLSISARITEISYDFDGDTISVTVANDQIKDDDEKLLDMIYSSANTATTVDMNIYKLEEGINAHNKVNEILSNAFDSARNIIKGGYNSTVTLSERGLLTKDLFDEDTYLVINNGQLAITPDGGNSVSVAIDKTGVHADKLVGKIILGNKLVIEDDEGIITTTGATQTVYNPEGEKQVELGRYVDPSDSNKFKYGLKIYGGAIDIVDGIQKKDISQEVVDYWEEGLQEVRDYSESVGSTVTTKISESDQLIRKDLRLNSPLPSSLTLDTNGITARTNNSDNFARLDHRGLYVQGGAMDIRTSTASYRGVQITGEGISAYNTNGTQTFGVSSTSGQISIVGSLSIKTSGSAYRGVELDSNGLRGYNTSGVKTFEIDSSGNVNVKGNITSGSSISGASISGTSISGGTISGTTITGTTVNSSNFNLLDAGNFNAYSSTIDETSFLIQSGLFKGAIGTGQAFYGFYDGDYGDYKGMTGNMSEGYISFIYGTGNLSSGISTQGFASIQANSGRFSEVLTNKVAYYNEYGGVSSSISLQNNNIYMTDTTINGNFNATGRIATPNLKVGVSADFTGASVTGISTVPVFA